jgi:hypothetical protein
VGRNASGLVDAANASAKAVLAEFSHEDWRAPYPSVQRREIVNAQFQGPNSIVGIAEWLGEQGTPTTQIQWERPTASWGVLRLLLEPFDQQCRVEVWNEDGDIRAFFDGTWDLTFDEAHRMGWSRLVEYLDAVISGQFALVRMVPFLPWRPRILNGTRSARYSPCARFYDAYVDGAEVVL